MHMKNRKILLTLSILGAFLLCSCNKPTNNNNSSNNEEEEEVDDAPIKTFKKRMPAEFEPVSMVSSAAPQRVRHP